VGASKLVIAQSLDDMIFHTGGANAPQRAHAAWLLDQMRRWNHLPATADPARIAARVYRPEFYLMAARSLGMSVATQLEAFGGA
jgi:hypothetical protein